MRTWSVKDRFVHEIPCGDLETEGTLFLDDGVALAISKQQARVYQVDKLPSSAGYDPKPDAPLFILLTREIGSRRVITEN